MDYCDNTCMLTNSTFPSLILNIEGVRTRQFRVSDISPTLQESPKKSTVWSDFVHWFQLFVIQICTLMDDSTFACRKSSLRAFIWCKYIYPFHQKCHLRPSCSHTCIEIDMLCLFFLVSINDDWWLKTRGGTVHVFVPNHHVTDLSVRCMMPDNEYRRFTPNPEGVMQRCLITASRRIANATSCALVLKTKPPDSDHVLILNASLT